MAPTSIDGTLQDEKPRRVPRSTYRLQFHKNFTFRHAAALVPYLHELGISDVYASPFLKARAGSLHGYDVVDPTQINPEVGSEADLAAFVAVLRRHGMGMILDVVPNHMCITDPDNRWWTDVLENGPGSPYAAFFDIDWHPPKIDLADKVHLPILGDQYGKVLENGEIRIEYEGGAFWARYYAARLPIAPRTWTKLLDHALEGVRKTFDESDPRRLELESIRTALEHLPLRTETDPEKVKERQREKEIIKKRLGVLLDTAPDVRAEIDKTLAEFNGVKGRPRTFDRLEDLLAGQAYRLCFWQVAADEVNYRRFFDINELAAIRVEDPLVFEAVHERTLGFVSQGWVTGLRVDHVDGLFDPQGYLGELRRRSAEAAAEPGAGPFYVVVEKILCGNERLRGQWPVHGTTGYDFMNLVNGLFVDGSRERAVRKIYRSLSGVSSGFAEQLVASKKFIMLVSLSSELHVLAWMLDRITEQHRWSRDFTRESLRFALREIIACLPVYRTYLRLGRDNVDEDDRRCICKAVDEAKHRNPATSESIFDFVRSVLLLEYPDELSEEHVAARRRFVMQFQQVTSPVMAKGMEDTAFYRFFPLVSLNEVGGDPERFGVAPAVFHREITERASRHPYTLSATTTHDTKRAEDARARVNVLSEIPKEWESAVRRWRRLNAKRRSPDGPHAPDFNEEYLLYQTLLGAWPLDPADPADFVRRIKDFSVKAVREAKLHSSWFKPNRPHEDAVGRFIEGILEPSAKNKFLPDFAAFQELVARAGMLNSLAQTLFKIACPGVPDFYQGTELWDLSLVDPDNRRPVDYERRQKLFAGLKPLLDESPAQPTAKRHRALADMLDRWPDGRVKLFLTAAALRARRGLPGIFLDGNYTPLEAEGGKSEHVVSFARRGEGGTVIAAGPRLAARLLGKESGWPLGNDRWTGTTIQLGSEFGGKTYRNIFTGETVETPDRRLAAGEAFNLFPVALLHADS